MTISLSGAFEKQQVAVRLREMLAKAGYIDGGYEMGVNQGTVMRHLAAQDRIYEWKVKREPSVLLLPPDFGQALLPHLKVPVVYSRFYDPGKRMLQEARRGQVAIGFIRRNKLHHFMMGKQMVESVLDPLAQSEQQLSEAVRMLEESMKARGLELNKDGVEALFRKLDQQDGPA